MKIFSSWIHVVWMISGFTFLVLIEIGFSVNFCFHQKSDPHKMAASCENIDWGFDYYSKYGQEQLSGKITVDIIPILQNTIADKLPEVYEAD